MRQESETLQCHFQEPSVSAHGKALQVLQPKAWMDLPRRKLRGQGSHCCEVSHQWKWPAQQRTRLGGEVEADPVVSSTAAARGSVHRSGSALKKKRAACVCCRVAGARPCLNCAGIARKWHGRDTASSLGTSLRKALPEMALALARQLPSTGLLCATDCAKAVPAMALTIASNGSASNVQAVPTLPTHDHVARVLAQWMCGNVFTAGA